MADDIGWFNVSCYNNGVMGYRTPNIDRIAREGANFTDFYGQQSCTAGRASFITGQSPIRTGLTKVGLPGAKTGPQRRRPDRRRVPEVATATPPVSSARTIWATATNTCRPCTASTSSSATSITSTPRRSRSRGLSQGPGIPEALRPARRDQVQGHETDDATEDEQFGRVGKQVIENTGPMPIKRMETVDEEFIGAALDFIDRKTAEDAPWLLLFQPDPHARRHPP
jgi:arylsulfatase A-like enzyme